MRDDTPSVLSRFSTFIQNECSSFIVNCAECDIATDGILDIKLCIALKSEKKTKAY
jgi:hypothetical protein